MSTLTAFQQKQKNLLALLGKLQQFIQQGSEFGLELPKKMYRKLDDAINNTQSEKLKIALIGGFSEGKTSIIAAWLGKIDKNSMNISKQESSNAVEKYDIDDDYIIIDTPGLYGYKEQKNSENEIEKYKDITKKYVSEAHIVLYVMNSKNPIKESHKEDLVWLLKDLNLLKRTVFVLSRFDEVADVEDESEYQHHLSVKQENVKGRLREFLNLSDDEVNSLNIVAVSANPFDEGVDYWLENKEEFERLSHIGTLQEATQSLIEKSGGVSNIVDETRKSIFNDILLKEITIMEEKDRELNDSFERIVDLYDIQNAKFEQLSRKINNVRANLKMQLNDYFTSLILQLSGLSLETAKSFFDTEIGEEGCLINSNIQQIFYNETSSAIKEVNNQIIQFDFEINQIDTAFEQLAKKGINHVVKNFKFNREMVLMAKDGINHLAKLAGFNKLIKFKPYGAINAAKNLNVALATVGVLVEVFDSFKKVQREEKFRKSIDEFIGSIQEEQKSLLELIDGNRFIPTFFQGYIELQKALEQLLLQKQNEEERKENFEKWKEERKIIEAEFEQIN